VNAVLAEDAFLAEMTKFRIRNGAGRVAVIHRVAAHTFRIGRFNNDVAVKLAISAR